MEEHVAASVSCAQDGMLNDASGCPSRLAAATGTRSRVSVAVGSTKDYEETGYLDEGGFGVVVKARHRATGQTVAIKRLIPTDDADDSRGLDLEELLLREARFHEACGGNPFIVGFHGLVRDPDTAHLGLVMEFVDGPTFYTYLQERRRGSPRLPEATARAVMWQLLTGAKEMHDNGIVHRDISPCNILVGGGHRVLKICDFGLAVSMSESDPPPFASAGSLWYKAPEILLEMHDYDTRADTWSLGCIMAEMICGRAPFAGNYDEREYLCAIFDVLGMPDGKTWPGFSSTTFATEVLPELVDVQRRNRLRELFPRARLSTEGFEVLDGLLTCIPDKRLTAAAALKLPWFAKVEALELPSEGT